MSFPGARCTSFDKWGRLSVFPSFKLVTVLANLPRRPTHVRPFSPFLVWLRRKPRIDLDVLSPSLSSSATDGHPIPSLMTAAAPYPLNPLGGYQDPNAAAYYAQQPQQGFMANQPSMGGAPMPYGYPAVAASGSMPSYPGQQQYGYGQQPPAPGGSGPGPSGGVPGGGASRGPAINPARMAMLQGQGGGGGGGGGGAGY